MNTLVPMGDQAALAYFADETAAFCFATALRRSEQPWLVDVVQSYRSVAAFFDLGQANFAQVAALMGRISATKKGLQDLPERRRHRIPCCYEMQLDMARVAEHTHLTAQEVIQLHAETEYTVCAIGFCPGFPFLGYLPPVLCGVPRLTSPRLRVEPGTVGLTRRQTGIYTEARPGGWNLIGRTPLELVHVADGYFPLRTGDRLQFERIDAAEFQRLLGERL
jgi:inhibitor of KinA